MAILLVEIFLQGLRELPRHDFFNSLCLRFLKNALLFEKVIDARAMFSLLIAPTPWRASAQRGILKMCPGEPLVTIQDQHAKLWIG